MLDVTAALQLTKERVPELSDEKLVAIVDLLERVREHPKAREVIDSARSRLARLRPPRRPSVRRTFYRPVEDLLADGGASPAATGRIGREIMARCWRLVESAMGREAVARLEKKLDANVPGAGHAYARIGPPLWQKSARLLTGAIAKAERDSALVAAWFGDEDTVEVARDIAAILEIANEIEALKLRLPERPVIVLSDDERQGVKDTMSRVRQTHEGKLTLFVWVVSARMASPAAFLSRVLDEGVGAGSSVLEQRKLVDFSVARMAGDISRIAHPEPADGADPLELANRAMAIASDLAALRALAAKNGMRDRVDGLAASMRNVVQHDVLDRATTAVLGSLAGQAETAGDACRDGLPGGGFGLAERHISALRTCRKFADALQLETAVAKGLEEIRRRVEESAKGVLRIMPDADQAARADARQQFYGRIRLMELAAGSEAGARLLAQGLARMG